MGSFSLSFLYFKKLKIFTSFFSLLLLVMPFAACAEVLTKSESMVPVRDTFFINSVSTCDFDESETYSSHVLPVEVAISPDNRWIVTTPESVSQHIIHLYDVENSKKYIIFHPNIEVGLSDVSFDFSSSYLSFIGSPWRIAGLSEMFVVDLKTMKHYRYGDIRHTYRFPVVINSQRELLFYESRPGPRSIDRSLLELANQERLSFQLGLLRNGENFTYLKAMPAQEEPFADWQDNRSSFEVFSAPPGIGISDDGQEYYAYSSLAYRVTGGGKKASSFDEIEKVTLKVNEQGLFEADKANANYGLAMQRLNPSLPKVVSEMAYIEDSVCLSKAHDYESHYHGGE
jgi:hypothetical protein